MNNDKHHFYFAIAAIAILATGSFVMLEAMRTTTDLILIEGSLFNIVRNGEARSLSEFNLGLQEINLNTLESGFEGIDGDINTL